MKTVPKIKVTFIIIFIAYFWQGWLIEYDFQLVYFKSDTFVFHVVKISVHKDIYYWKLLTTSFPEYFLASRHFKTSCEYCPAYVWAVFITDSDCRIFCALLDLKSACKQSSGGAASNHSSKLPLPGFACHERSTAFSGILRQEANRKVCWNVSMRKTEKKWAEWSSNWCQQTIFGTAQPVSHNCAQRRRKRFPGPKGSPEAKGLPTRRTRGSVRALRSDETRDPMSAAYPGRLPFSYEQVTNSKQKVARNGAVMLYLKM